MIPLTLQQQLARLRRERVDSSARLRVHALADEDNEAVELYERLLAMDSEIYSLEQRKQDALQAQWLAEQGAAAVREAEAIVNEARR